MDLTSSRFEYSGSGVAVTGGAGNDVIWANKGKNILFGDAGNDRIVGASGNDTIVGGAGNDSMHGGGGDDTFTFGGNWGQDTIEQLATGTVTLWFDQGDASKWNADTLTYTDGENSVTVTGVEDVTLVFGAENEQFDKLYSVGAFSDFASENLYTKISKALIAWQ